MLSYKEYKRIYKTTTFLKYIWNYVLLKPRKWKRIPYCIYMCLKYPFLYPRNRFTGLHYNNWQIHKFLNNLNKQYRKSCYHNYPPKNAWYVTGIVGFETYWINWWAKPIYVIVSFLHNVILQILFCLPTSIEWDSVEPGWKKAFGNQYLKDLRKQLKQEGNLYKFRIMQIKEKWGRFQLYPAKASEEVYKIIDKYEYLSFEVCIYCGNKATHTTTGWILPCCEECVKKNNHIAKKRS